jgi:hypothetical protein
VRALVLLVALVVAGCGFQSLAWPVGDATTVDDLDAKYREQIAIVNADDLCVFGDPLRRGYSTVSGCERLRHQVFADYWRARRELADLKGWE